MKKRGLSWHKHAQHAVPSRMDIKEPHVVLPYARPYEVPASTKAYKLDQALCKLGIPYYAEWINEVQGFRITVSERSAPLTSGCIKALEGR